MMMMRTGIGWSSRNDERGSSRLDPNRGCRDRPQKDICLSVQWRNLGGRDIWLAARLRRRRVILFGWRTVERRKAIWVAARRRNAEFQGRKVSKHKVDAQLELLISQCCGAEIILRNQS